MVELARILFYGDLHLCSKNYGAHRDYPSDSLKSLQIVTETAEKFKPTHIIGLGDLTYGRFNSLEYRTKVEKELTRQNKICNNNRYELQGNHDSAGYGMTEFDYYIERGMMKRAENFTIGNYHFTLVDNGKCNQTPTNIGTEDGATNFMVVHDYFRFKDTNMPDYGTAMYLDEFTPWFGVDHIIAGHIHSARVFEGLMVKLDESTGVSVGHRATVDYVGSLSRPTFRENDTDEIGHLICLTLYEDSFLYDRLDIDLPPIAEVFNIEAKELEKSKKAEKQKRVDISDVVHQLDSHERNIGNPEDIIMSLRDVPDKYKLKAIDLLKEGLA